MGTWSVPPITLGLFGFLTSLSRSRSLCPASCSLLGCAGSVWLFSCLGDCFKLLGKYIKGGHQHHQLLNKICRGVSVMDGKGEKTEPTSYHLWLCWRRASSQHCPLSHILRAFVPGSQTLAEKRWAMELQSFCEVPVFHSHPLELLHFVQAIKYSLGQGEKSKRLSLLPSCSGVHLGWERCRVKSFSKDDLIIHTKWNSFSKKDVHASKTDSPLLRCTKPLPF